MIVHPPIILQDPDGTQRTLVTDKFVRWLGVHFDRKLLFNRHVKIIVARGENAVNAMSMLANTVRSLSQAHLRRLYLSCVVPKILYACPTWWNNTKCQAKPLEKVQRKALLLICAAFKTSPTTALEVEASIPPLKIQANLISCRYAIRLNKLPTSSAVIQRLPSDWRNNDPPTFSLPLPTTQETRRKPATTLKKLLEHMNHTHERMDPYLSPPWCRSTSLFPGRLIFHHCPSPSVATKA